MTLSPSQMQENLGTVVPVDDEQPLTIRIPGPGSTATSVGGPGGPGGGGGLLPPKLGQGMIPGSGGLLGTPVGSHKIVGAGDEHRILTTPGGGATGHHHHHHQNNQAYQRPPKFSVIVNEYVGACLEDHCNIGKQKILKK